MKRPRSHIILVVAVMMLSFVVVNKDKETLFNETLTKRIESYKQDLLNECTEDAIQEAEMKVDSIIAVELGAGPIDTIDFPRKPSKPNFESFDSLNQEQLDIKPLFDKVSIKEAKNFEN